VHRKYTFKITCRYNWSLLFIVLYLFEYSNVRMLGYFYLINMYMYIIYLYLSIYIYLYLFLSISI